MSTGETRRCRAPLHCLRCDAGGLDALERMREAAVARFPSPARSCARRRRMWCWSSAMLARWGRRRHAPPRSSIRAAVRRGWPATRRRRRVGIAVETDRSLADLRPRRRPRLPPVRARCRPRGARAGGCRRGGRSLVLCVSHVVLSLQVGFRCSVFVAFRQQVAQAFFAGVSGVRDFVQPA